MAPFPDGRWGSKFSRIIFCGTGLMAGSPTGICRPGLVILPTPLPPLIIILGLELISTKAPISRFIVTSGSG